MKEERLICPTTPKMSTVTERCLKTKLQIYTSPRNGTCILLCHVPHSLNSNHTDAKALDVCLASVALALVWFLVGVNQVHSRQVSRLLLKNCFDRFSL